MGKEWPGMRVSCGPREDSCANGVLTFQGTLKACGTVNGTYTNVVNAVSPYTNAPNGTLFFRAYQ